MNGGTVKCNGNNPAVWVQGAGNTFIMRGGQVLVGTSVNYAAYNNGGTATYYGGTCSPRNF